MKTHELRNLLEATFIARYNEESEFPDADGFGPRFAALRAVYELGRAHASEERPEPEITDEVFILDGELARDEERHELLPLPLAFPTREAAQRYVDSAGPLWGSWGIHRVPVAEGGQ